jgi:hypothetical protein
MGEKKNCCDVSGSVAVRTGEAGSCSFAFVNNTDEPQCVWNINPECLCLWAIRDAIKVNDGTIKKAEILRIEKDNRLKKFFNDCPTTAEISYLNGKYDSGIFDGENKPETEIKGNPCLIISWSEKGRGFGEYTFYYKYGKWLLDSECDSKEAVKRVLSALVDSIERI